jgi:hypothetical protein
MSLNIICHLLGHKWRYKDYTNAVKADGTKYQLSQVRKCMRCDEHEYKYDKWVKKEMAVSEDIQKM